MKTSPSSRRRAFTMIELLVVISIIAVLAGIVTGVSRGALERSKRSKTETQIRAISEALETYKAEYGNYPRPVGGTVNPIETAKMLYQAVTGDGSNYIDGADPAPSDGEPGTEGKFILEAAFSGSKKSSFVHKDYYLMDAWHRPYHYMRGDESNETMNKTTFDLWSQANDKSGEDEDVWISNWQ